MTSFANIGAGRHDQKPGRGERRQSIIDRVDAPQTSAEHDPEAKDLLRRYLSEIHSYRELGNVALRDLEKRLEALSDPEDAASGPIQPRAAINRPLGARALPQEGGADGGENTTLTQRLKELSAYLHEDLTRQKSAPAPAGSESGTPAAGPAMPEELSSFAADGPRTAPYAIPHKPTPSAPVLDRHWFEGRFATMRASIDQLAEKIPLARLDALETQFHQLMEKLDARESDRSMAAVEAGLKKLATYLEDNKEWARGQDERTRGVEERLDRLSGLVAQSTAALSATAKGLEIIARRTGPDLAEQTAEVIAQKLAPRLAELDQSEPLSELNGEVAKLSAQSKHYARATDERLKQLQDCLDEGLERLDTSQSEAEKLRQERSWARAKDENPLDDDYDGKMIAAARRAARLADGPLRDGEDGEPLRYRIPYGEFLPEDEPGTSRIGLVVAAIILIIASVAMLYFNLRDRDGNGMLSSAWIFGSANPGPTKASSERLAIGTVKTVVVEPGDRPRPPVQRPANNPMYVAVAPQEAREFELIRPDSDSDFIAAPDGGRSASLRAAAVSGNVDAQFTIGEAYLQGEGVDRGLPVGERFTKAARWFRRAAEKGHAASQYRLGTLSELGHGAPKDNAEAVRWYTLAAEAGHIKAMHNLGVLLIAADRTPENYAAAAHWFTKAADHGLRDSQFNLGVLFERGLGVGKDPVQAYRWFSLAAGQGDAKAAEKREQLSAALSAADLKREEGRTLAWTAQESDAAGDRKAPADRRSEARLVPAAIKPKAPVAEPAKAVWSAQISTMDSIVAEAQRLLAKLGLRPGPVDGVLGPKTVAAIRAFERKVGLPTTGQLTSALVARMASR
jgi:TPR repeat protein